MEGAGERWRGLSGAGVGESSDGLGKRVDQAQILSPFPKTDSFSCISVDPQWLLGPILGHRYKHTLAPRRPLRAEKGMYIFQPTGSVVLNRVTRSRGSFSDSLIFILTDLSRSLSVLPKALSPKEQKPIFQRCVLSMLTSREQGPHCE